LRMNLSAMACMVAIAATPPALAEGASVYTIEDFTAVREAKPVAVSPDGKSILYGVRSFGDKGPAKLEWRLIPVAGGESRKLELTDKFEPKGFTRDGALFGTYKLDDVQQLAIVPLAGPQPTVIISLPRGVDDAVISPDGSKVVLLADPRPKEPADSPHNVVENADRSLYVVSTGGRDGGWWCPELKSITAVAWSQDSRRLAVTTQLPRLGNRDVRSTVNICSTSDVRKLVDMANTVAGIAWSKDEKELVFASTEAPTLTPEHIWTVGVDGGAPHDRTPDLNGSAQAVAGDGHGNVWVAVNRGVVAEMDVFADGKLTPTLTWPGGAVMELPVASPFPDSPPQLAVSVADPKHSVNVAAVNAGQLGKLTDEGDARLAKLTLGDVKVVHWKSKEGIALEGILTLPPGYVSGRRYPFLVLPHGGPEANDLLRLDPLAQLIAAKGYVVLQPQYRGSTGYGAAFLASIYQHFGDRPYRDVDSATDFAIAQGWADPNRLAIFGWSAGGFMTAWTVTQTHRYKAAIEGAGITDWLSFIPTSDIPQTDYDQRLQEKDPSPLLRFSPVMHADQVTTPLLILHGAADVRVPTFQGQEFYVLLKERGKTVRMVTYPGSPHFPVLAEQRRDVLKEVSDWLDTYNP
jgi:dipeptidyl aminopeptidase/acylaminoacyl peptidase